MEAAPAAPFVIAKAEFLLELLIIALDSGRRLRGRGRGASTTTSRRLATATTSKGRCSGRSATTAPAASIRRSSLKAGIVAPSVMLRKLAAYRRQNQLDLALQELGRIERTLFMLDWLESPELRRRCHAGLNKSEQRHFLAQVICTFKQGRIADRSAEAQQFRASGLNLVIAAIVFWNSTYIADAIAHLRATEQSVPDAWLAHTSPLSWEHISFSGDFLWERAAATADKRRPLNLGQTRVAA